MSDNEEKEWEVKDILSYSYDDNDGSKIYKVLWIDGNITWEPEENLQNCNLFWMIGRKK